jgi:beta-galactosidase GanA
MNKTWSLGSLLLFAVAPCYGQTAAPLPQVRQNGQVKHLYVDNKPYIMLAGELHNSSASSIEFMKPVWDKLSAMHLNTVISTVSWELVEPAEGKFDFSLVDAQLKEARQRNMRLVMIWFATWKNASSSYSRTGSRPTRNGSRGWCLSRSLRAAAGWAARQESGP